MNAPSIRGAALPGGNGGVLAPGLEPLAARQNRDGGWPYWRGGSATEPTAYAVLALSSAGEARASAAGIRWLQALQRPDGGWPPQPGVERSSWVTAVVALLPPERLGDRAHGRAISWLLHARGEESTSAYRFRQWLLGGPAGAGGELAGWPWLPGSAAWIVPTALAVMALEKEVARRPSQPLRQRIDSGRKFILSRACAAGGWNHGSPEALGQPLPPYPETTGIALAALRGVRSPVLERAIARAGEFLRECRSADEWNWLRLGLMAHRRLPRGCAAPAAIAYRTLPEWSLDFIAARAEQATPPFWA